MFAARIFGCRSVQRHPMHSSPTTPLFRQGTARGHSATKIATPLQCGTSTKRNFVTWKRSSSTVVAATAAATAGEIIAAQSVRSPTAGSQVLMVMPFTATAYGRRAFAILRLRSHHGQAVSGALSDGQSRRWRVRVDQTDGALHSGAVWRIFYAHSNPVQIVYATGVAKETRKKPQSLLVLLYNRSATVTHLQRLATWHHISPPPHVSPAAAP